MSAAASNLPENPCAAEQKPQTHRVEEGEISIEVEGDLSVGKVIRHTVVETSSPLTDKLVDRVKETVKEIEQAIEAGGQTAPQETPAATGTPEPPKQTHWMVAAGLPPFDPNPDRYTKTDLEQMAAEYCKLNSIRGRPMGGVSARRKYRREGLLPWIPDDRWPLQTGRGGAPKKR
jgi:hypothetical protein